MGDAMFAHPVLFFEPQVGQVGQHARDRNRTVRRHEVERGLEHRWVAAELVDQESLDESYVVGLGRPHDIERPKERGEYATAIDIADDEHPRSLGRSEEQTSE